MAEQDSISFLKRKIIGVDKLVKNKNKTEAKNADLNNAIELKNKAIFEKDAEIKRLKTELLVKLVTSPKKNDGKLSNLEKELEETRKMLEEKTIKVAKFKEESVSRSQKIGQLEIDLGKRNSKFSLLEKELVKKNSDIINRELESQEMKKTLEELKASKESLERDLKSGKHVETMKQSYDDLKWRNLAEISSLKQEKAALDKRNKELELDKTSDSKDSDSKKLKANEGYEKQLEKKDKSIAYLEKRLEKALKDNEKLKLRLSKKVRPSGDDSKEDMDKSFESDMDVSDAALTEDETEIVVPPPRKTFSFSFSKPNARFSICKPNLSNQRRTKVKFKKSSSLIENLPVVFNLTPSISDSLPNLTPTEPVVKPPKRKLEEESLKTPTPKKKLKYSQSINQAVPDSTSPPLLSTLQPASTSSHYSSSTSSQDEPFMLPMVPTPLNQSTPVSFPSSSHNFPLPLPPTPVNYSNPNPTKARNAHTTKYGIAPLKLPKQITPKFEKLKSGSTSKLKMTPPPQLSPIKSPKVLPCKQEPAPASNSAPITAPTNTARARILASNLAPQAVEAQVKVVGGKLNQAQLEAAKRRAIPSVTHLPSVNGFRQSANEIKAAGKAYNANATNGKDALEKKRTGKADKKPQSTPEELLYCPSRRRTNPTKVSATSSSELNQQSDASRHGEKSKESEGGKGIDDITVNSDTSEVSVEDEKAVNPPKSQPISVHKIKSKEFISTEESSDDELNIDVSCEIKNAVVSFDEVSLINSSHEVIAPVKEKSREVKGSQLKRSESIEDDLDISDSDDDGRNDFGLLVDYPGEDRVADQTPSKSNGANSNQDAQKALSTPISNKKSQVEDAVKSEPISVCEGNKKLEKSREVSEDEDNSSSGRFDRLKSESKPLGTCQLQEGKIKLQDEAVLQEGKVKLQDEAAPSTSAPNTGRRFFSQLEELRFHFQSRTSEDMKRLQQERDKLSRERSSFAYEAYVDIVKRHFKNLMGCQNEESFCKIVEGIASNSNHQNEAIVCDLVYEYLKAEHRESPLMNATDENQPAITRKQQRLFVMLTTLAERPRYKNILDRMLNLLWHNLFGRDRMFNLKLNAVQNSGRMFVLCARFTDSVSLMKHFIFDLFYFKSPRNHILIGIMIALWPEIFPHGHSSLSTTPMAETIAWCIFNTGPAQKSPEMLVQETKDNFVREYGYKANAVKADTLVMKFIKLAEDRSHNKELLEEVAMCLLLIGRSKEFRWVNNNISARLLKSLASVWGGADTGDQTVLRWVITTLGLLSRVYPAEGRDQVKTLYTSVESLLQKGASLQPETELACINALLHLGYHLQSQVAMFLKTWHPSHPLDTRTRRMLEDFVGTRGKKHAEITAKVARIEHNKARKRKGLKMKQ